MVPCDSNFFHSTPTVCQSSPRIVSSVFGTTDNGLRQHHPVPHVLACSRGRAANSAMGFGPVCSKIQKPEGIKALNNCPITGARQIFLFPTYCALRTHVKPSFARSMWCSPDPLYRIRTPDMKLSLALTLAATASSGTRASLSTDISTPACKTGASSANAWVHKPKV